MKYEFKACGRTFFPIYIGILVLAAVNGIFNNYDIFKMAEDGSGFSMSITNAQGILIIVLFALFVALFVLTIVLTIQRFKKNLLEDEGYLMFTLPVNSRNLILSKYLVALIFIVLSTLVAIISFIFVGMFSGSIKFSDIMIIINQSDLPIDFWKSVLVIIIGVLIMYSTFILTVYLAISVGQFPQFNKHRTAAGIIAFFVINTVVGYIQGIIYDYIIPESVSTEVTNGITVTTNGYNVLIFALNILIVVLLFLGINWILNKKLNLE